MYSVAASVGITDDTTLLAPSEDHKHVQFSKMLRNGKWPLASLAWGSRILYTGVVPVPGDTAYVNVQLVNLLHYICT